MIRVCWFDLNSSYSHSSLALPAIEANQQLYRGEDELRWERISSTLRNNPDETLDTLLKSEADVVCATVWLFTHIPLMEILSRYASIRPQTKIFLGGPEFLGNNEAFLRRHPFVAGVFRGDGEEGFYRWLEQIDHRDQWQQIEGICYLWNGIYVDGGNAAVSCFARLSPPSQSQFFPIDKPFVQLETNRGCYNTCTFCVSGNDHRTVQHLPTETIAQQLDYFVERGIREIRLLDRTFNSNPRRAIDLLHLFASYHGRLSFHLEIHPALLTIELTQALDRLPAGLLHLEAGIQSLNQTSIDTVCRKGNVANALKGLAHLFTLTTMQTHVDLIVGLPHYTYRQLLDDARQLITMGAHELQIELLKLLPGTALKCEAGQRMIDYNANPPYEVQKTPHMSRQEIQKSVTLSRIVDIFYNDQALQRFFARLVTAQHSFLEQWTEHAFVNGYFDSPQSKEQRLSLLLDYVAQHHAGQLCDGQICWLLAGLSLYKLPHATVTKQKEKLPVAVETVHGQLSDSQRWYRFRSGTTTVYMGYDRAVSQSRPQFIGLEQSS